MKTFLAIYIGTEAAFERSGWNQMEEQKRKERSAEGFKAWMDWGHKHAAAIVEVGAPLGKTKRVAPEGISDIKNVMTGYVVVRAETHEAAAKMFLEHPHFTVFPGESVEIMECLPMPKE